MEDVKGVEAAGDEDRGRSGEGTTASDLLDVDAEEEMRRNGHLVL